MFHIFSVCPSSLISNNVHSHFSSIKGNFISKNIPKNYKLPFTWNDKKLSDEEKTKLNNVLDLLDRRKALIANKNVISGIEGLISHLNSPASVIENAISDEIDPSKCDKIVSTENFQLNTINGLSKSCDILKTADNILNLINPFILQSYNFKIVDPYFYKDWFKRTEQKVEFLTKLCDYLSKNHKEIAHINIEIFGQGFDNDRDSRGKSFANYLQKELRSISKFREFYDSGFPQINFYGLSQINSKKVHDRLFICDQFSFALNDGFYSEPNVNNELTLIDDLTRINKFQNMYQKETEDFHMEFNFSLEDIFD